MSSTPMQSEEDLLGSPLGSAERPLRISEINRAVRATLESEWTGLWVEGELSNVSRSAAGHVYFTLNDETEKTGGEKTAQKGVTADGRMRVIRMVANNGNLIRQQPAARHRRRAQQR